MVLCWENSGILFLFAFLLHLLCETTSELYLFCSKLRFLAAETMMSEGTTPPLKFCNFYPSDAVDKGQ